ncbi:DUF4351 domain-containing protein [uncultured Castellaniella sp.]|uniref:DUF4351 domain-containing protein n=1 Tax=uncultured Castellaniella sp. TaxID=647907 RepID=UPI00260ACF9F|nr:DUF4351 domain-containing protein [uncultured Castellaniella sp.]
MSDPERPADDHDSPWKDALELYFPQAMALLASDLQATVDWSAPIVFLDKELQAVKRASAPAQGRRHADKLVQVQLLNGGKALLLVHVEVQGRLSGPRALQVFGWRMLEYKVLICQRERRKSKSPLPPQIYSLGVLIDQPVRTGGTRPAATLTYRDRFLNQRTRFTFPIVELERWRARQDELDRLAPLNPFAVLIMAQLQASGHPDKATRLAPLVSLTRRLYGYGYTRDQIGQLLRLVEWVIGLPPELEVEYHLAARQLEQEYNMSYVTIAERYGMAKGEEKGLQKGMRTGQAKLLLGMVQRRFGPLSDDTVQRILSAKASELETWSLNILDASALEDVFRG